MPAYPERRPGSAMLDNGAALALALITVILAVALAMARALAVDTRHSPRSASTPRRPDVSRARSPKADAAQPPTPTGRRSPKAEPSCLSRGLEYRLRINGKKRVVMPWERTIFAKDSRPLQELFDHSTPDERRAALEWYGAVPDGDRAIFCEFVRGVLVRMFETSFQRSVHDICRRLIDETVAGIMLRHFSVVVAMLNTSLSFDSVMETVARDVQCGTSPLEHHPLLRSTERARRDGEKVLGCAVGVICASLCFGHQPRSTDRARACIACTDAPIDAPLTCGHTVLCRACASRMMNDDGDLRCPTCMARVRVVDVTAAVRVGAGARRGHGNRSGAVPGRASDGDGSTTRSK